MDPSHQKYYSLLISTQFTFIGTIASCITLITLIKDYCQNLDVLTYKLTFLKKLKSKLNQLDSNIISIILLGLIMSTLSFITIKGN